MSDNALWVHFVILSACSFYKGLELSGTCYDNVWADIYLNGGSPDQKFEYLSAADMFTWKGWLTAYAAYIMNNLTSSITTAVAVNGAYTLAYVFNSGWSLCGEFDSTGAGALPVLSPEAFPYFSQSDPIPWFFGLIGIC